MSELKCCPFCGGEARLYSFHSQTIKTYKEYWVKCKNDCCQTKNFRSEEKAVEQWNTRTPMDNIVEKLEELKKDNTNGCEKVNQELCNSYLDCGLCLIDRIINIVKQEINNGLE